MSDIYWLAPLLTCSAVAVVLVAGGFVLGVWWSKETERTRMQVRSHVRLVKEGDRG